MRSVYCFTIIVITFLMGILVGFSYGYGKGAIDTVTSGLKAIEYADNINIDINETLLAQTVYELMNKTTEKSLPKSDDGETGDNK
jgi:hypothetical protein